MDVVFARSNSSKYGRFIFKQILQAFLIILFMVHLSLYLMFPPQAAIHNDKILCMVEPQNNDRMIASILRDLNFLRKNMRLLNPGRPYQETRVQPTELQRPPDREGRERERE